MSVIERIIFLVGGVLLVTTDLKFNAIGAVAIAAVFFMQRAKSTGKALA
jgi:hypothetical protein